MPKVRPGQCVSSDHEHTIRTLAYCTARVLEQGPNSTDSITSQRAACLYASFRISRDFIGNPVRNEVHADVSIVNDALIGAGLARMLK